MPAVPPGDGLYYIVGPSPKNSKVSYTGLVLVPQVDDGEYIVGRHNTENIRIPSSTRPLLPFLRQHGYKLRMNAPEVPERQASLISPDRILGSE